MEHGTWNIPWNTEQGSFPGTWNMERGTWNMELGTTEFETWNLEHGT